MYEISIIGASDSRDTYEKVNEYHIFFDEESKSRVLKLSFNDSSLVLIYLGINDRVEIEKV